MVLIIISVYTFGSIYLRVTFQRQVLFIYIYIKRVQVQFGLLVDESNKFKLDSI